MPQDLHRAGITEVTGNRGIQVLLDRRLHRPTPALRALVHAPRIINEGTGNVMASTPILDIYLNSRVLRPTNALCWRTFACCAGSSRKRDITGMLDHFILLAEKAEKDVFIDEALLAYDTSVKERAKEYGLKEFDTLKPSEIVKHLSYDGTKAGSTKVSRKAVRQQASGSGNHGGGSSSGACLKYNFASGGCVCSQCPVQLQACVFGLLLIRTR